LCVLTPPGVGCLRCLVETCTRSPATTPQSDSKKKMSFDYVVMNNNKEFYHFVAKAYFSALVGMVKVKFLKIMDTTFKIY